MPITHMPGPKTADVTAESILAAAEEILPWLAEIRRDFHQHPELGLEEHRTAARVAEILDEIGIEHRDGVGQTGVVGLIRGTEGGSVVALRGDMDALPIQEANDVPYRSTVPGKMHACGHDVHTTVVLGAARILAGLGELPGSVKLFFQPAEETVGGALLMIEDGALENPKVDAVFGLHVEPDIDVGTVELRYGQRNASSDDIAITVHGRSGHAAYPANTVDAVVVAAQVVSALQTVVSRNVDARDAAVLTFGTIRGGTQGNIVAGEVELVGTLRTLDPDVRELVRRRLRETAEGVAQALGGRAEVWIDPSYDPLINDDAMVDVVRSSAVDLLGEENVFIKEKPNMGVEDFAYFASQVPSAFYSLGVRNEAKGIVHTIHNERFDVDERCLAIGVALQVLNVLNVLNSPRG